MYEEDNSYILVTTWHDDFEELSTFYYQKEEDGKIALFLENLWQPGLTLTRPEITKRLLDKIEYPNKLQSFMKLSSISQSLKLDLPLIDRLPS